MFILWSNTLPRILSAVLTNLIVFAGSAFAQFPDWKHTGSFYLVTTPEGANLPASASLTDFPILVRLHQDSFDFSQAKANGDDLRFSNAEGKPLAYQIEDWDAKNGSASIWVRIPKIAGNTRQEIKLHWGKPDAASESNGRAVFDKTNGYLGVWHMGDGVKDDAGGLETKDTGTTKCEGVVGSARHFAGSQGLFCGEKIANFPTGSDSHSSQAWFRAEKSNGRILAWGNEQPQGKVTMNIKSPPHVNMDCWFSGGNVTGTTKLSFGEWVHVVHTFEKGMACLYINGVLDNAVKRAGSTMAIKSPAKMWIGGWYKNYDFIGDIDEVRISNVVRSADWVKLEYENQKPTQTLVGPLVQAGNEFSVSVKGLDVAEGKIVSLTGKAGGAQLVYWIVKSDGKETIVMTDRFTFPFATGRVASEKKATIQFKAVYPNETKTLDIPVVIRKTIPDPVFTLQAPKTWDGRSTIEVATQITNADEMMSKGSGELNTTWNVADIAVIKEVVPGKLILKRSQNSGKMIVTARIHNGGQPTTQSVEIAVTEPAKDAWVARTAAPDEKPMENQFYARDDKNEGALVYNGTLTTPANHVFLKLYADDKLVATETSGLGKNNDYALSTKLKPGLIRYKVEFGSKTGDNETVLNTVGNLVCGDAYIIQGQSNAVAYDFGKEDPTFRSDWIRSVGNDPKAATIWGNAVYRGNKPGSPPIGYWGMELGKRLVETHKIPVCFINGAVGGTRIDQHQRNEADPEDPTTIYGRLLSRVKQAKLTHGIRGILWHQGENDQGADGPTGGYGYENYRQYFLDLADGWKRDYPNIQHYYIFQIWPKSCGMGINGSDNRLREVQRTLPTAFSHMSIMSTLGIDPPGGCHFPAGGYAEFARLICPLVERDNYGVIPKTSITPANLKHASFANGKNDEIVLEFDQPVKWDNALAKQFYLDGDNESVVSGSVAGNVLTLKLASPSKAKAITYLDSKAWSQATLLRGANDIAALTFCEVPVFPAKP